MLATLLTLHNFKVASAVLTTAVTAAGIYCASTPTPDPNTLYGKVYKVIEYIGMNFGRAKQVYHKVEDAVKQAEAQTNQPK